MGREDSNERKILDTLPRIAAAADDLANAFAERANGDQDVVAAGYLLGAGAAAHWARRLAGAGGLGLRVVDRVRLERTGSLEAPPEGGASSIVVDDLIPAAALVQVLFAARHGLRPRLSLGPKSAPYAAAIQRAVGDLIDGDVATTEAAANDDIVSYVVVSPFYWDKRDMDRITRHLALEVLAPPPGTTRVEFAIANGWEQHKALWPRVLERIEKVPAAHRPPFQVELPDCGTALETLRYARELVDEHNPSRVALYLHPMWRENQPARTELAAIAATGSLHSLSIGHRASLPWSLGAGGFGERARVDVSAPMPSLGTPASAKRRVLFATRPTLTGATRLAIAARL